MQPVTASEGDDAPNLPSVDRLKCSANDRDRRRQIIAKLQEQRRKYRGGNSFQNQFKTLVIKHKYNQKQQQRQQLRNLKDHEMKPKSIPLSPSHSDESDDVDKIEEHGRKRAEEEERKSESVSGSTSLSLSPIKPVHSRIQLHQHNHSADKTLDFSKLSKSSKSGSSSPLTDNSPRRHSLSALSVRQNDKHSIHQIKDEEEDSFYRDSQIDEIRNLKIQTQRLSNKLEHVNNELVETQVFLRSERQRNKKLFGRLKSKEEMVDVLNRQIDALEVEMKRIDGVCAEHEEKLCQAEKQNKTLIETLAMNRDLNSKLKEYRMEIKEWKKKYDAMADECELVKQQHRQQMEQIQEELDQKGRTEKEIISKFNQVISSQNVELESITKSNGRLLDAVEEITGLMQCQIQSNGEDTVSHHLRAMLEDEIEEVYEAQDDAEIQGAIDLLVQSLIGVIEKSNGLEQHNNELSAYLNKYDDEKDAAKRTISEQEQKCKNQQDRILRLQENYRTLNHDKLQIECKYTEATKKLKNVAVQVTVDGVIGDIDMHQCIEVINDSVLSNKRETRKLKTLLNQVVTQYQTQMDSMESVFRKSSTNWSHQIHRLQDKLSKIQIAMIRTNGTDASFTSNISTMSMVSDLNRPFPVDDIESQYSQQMVLINELKEEIKSKQQVIDTVNAKSDHLQRCKLENLEATITNLNIELKRVTKERDEALHDFKLIEQEWQRMKMDIDAVHQNKQSLEMQLKDLEYWIKYIEDYVNQRVNGNDDESMHQMQFESISGDIPKSLYKLYKLLMDILTRMHLSELNETSCDDINDTAILEQIFGPIPECEESQIEAEPNNVIDMELTNIHVTDTMDEEEEKREVDDKESLRRQVEFDDMKEARDALTQSVHELEAKMCLEQVLHKVELNHVGNEAEHLIAAYQQRMKTYVHFIKQLQGKVAESSKVIASITLERDHSWKQYQNSQTKVEALTKTVERLQAQNESLETTIRDDQEEMDRNNKAIQQMLEQYRVQSDSVQRQLKVNEQSNHSMQQRLQDSTLMIKEITQQRDEIQQEYATLSDEFSEYQAASAMLFKRALISVSKSFTPLMDNMDQYAMVGDRIDGLKRKVERLKDHMTTSRVKQEQGKNEEIQEAVEHALREHVKVAQSKARMHADIHRFQYAKYVAEMKQKHSAQINQLEVQIRSVEGDVAKSHAVNASLSETLQRIEKEKFDVDGQLMQIKKSFNEEIVNYQNVLNENKENERKLSGIIHGLKQQLEERKQYEQGLEKKITEGNREEEELRYRLREQTNKSQELHQKIVNLRNEISSMQSKYSEIRREIEELMKEKESDKTQIEQLEALNTSLKEAMDTKELNHHKMQEIHDAEVDELRAALRNVEAANNGLNDESEEHRREIKKYTEELRRMESTNTELMERIHTMNSNKLHEGRQWFDKEEDLRNEINAIRQQLHDANNEMAVMKFESLEKDSVIKKLENAVSGLKEEVTFHKEREQKEKQERGLLAERVSKHDAIHENKINDIKMILDAKAVRIIRLQDEMQEKNEMIKQLETQVIHLSTEVAAARSLMDEEKNLLMESQHLESDKLKSIIADITDELNAMKSERGQLTSALETQKNVNVQLSLELDSMKGYLNKEENTMNNVSLYGDHDDGDTASKTEDVAERPQNENNVDGEEESHFNSSLIRTYFYDTDLETSSRDKKERRDYTTTSPSMSNLEDRRNEENEIGSDEEVLQDLNLQSRTTIRSDAERDNGISAISINEKSPAKDSKQVTKRRKGPGLPLPSSRISKSSRSMETVSNHNASRNAEGFDSQ